MTLAVIAFLLFGQAVPPASYPRATFEQLSQRAREADNAGRTADAVNLYRSALKLKPEWAQGWWGLGALQYAEKQFAGCRDAMVQLTRIDPVAAAGWALRGICEYETKEYDPALQHLFRAREIAPGKGELSQTADYYYARLMTRRGGFEVSLMVFSDLARRIRNDDGMSFACGIAALRIPALPDEVKPVDREVVTLAGRAFWITATGAPEEAEAAYKRLLEAYPKYANVHYLFGAWLSVERPILAADEFRKELEITPRHAPARTRLALIELERGDIDAALRFAEQATTDDPQYLPAHLAYGRVLLQDGKAEAAAAALTRARDLDPESRQVRFLLMSAYRELGRTADAERESREFQRLTGRSNPAR